MPLLILVAHLLDAGAVCCFRILLQIRVKILNNVGPLATAVRRCWPASDGQRTTTGLVRALS